MTARVGIAAPTRRGVLATAAAVLLAGPARAGAARLDFDELYGSIGVLGAKLSDKTLGLAGQMVTMRGYMAPPLKAEANFFVLTQIPMSLCPFCSSDADWPADIVVVYLGETRTFVQANAAINVTGRLEEGSWTDPVTGFVSLLRLVQADFGRA